MPKIIIREYDNTKAPSTAYNNFAVVVPGLCGPSYNASVFDENGVYECSSQADFEKNVGKKAATRIALVQEAKALELDDTVISADNFEEYRDSGILYYVKPKDVGDNTEGYLEDGHNKYVQVGKSEDFIADFAQAGNGYSGYKVIQKGNEGVDEIRTLQMGNQIAYELLGLGYPVLFKNINTPDVDELGSDEFWAPLKDKAAYDFRYIVTGLDPLSQDTKAVKKVNNAIIKLATAVNKVSDPADTGRGDCIALVDICSSAYRQKSQAEAITNITSQVNDLTASKYAAAFAPYVTYAMVEDKIYKNTTFPASFHYLACAAKAAENYNEWYAIAGYDRGVSDYTIKSVGCKFGDIAVNALCPRNNKGTVKKAVNVIAKIKNNYYLWGNRTLNALGDELIASDSLNIRQLCTSIKKQIYVACKKFTFDPNSDVLWINFQNAITPLLEKMKADQGLSDYKFIKCKTNKKAVLMAKLRIVPIEAVEDFEIDLTLENSIAGTTVGIDE